MRKRVISVLVVAASLLLAVPQSSSAMATQPSSKPAASTFTMPRLVGMVLQDAQDLLQSKGSYVVSQEDALGWDRWQLLDSNWKVCRQTPLPGKRVSVSATVTLWSVKLNERCPR